MGSRISLVLNFIWYGGCQSRRMLAALLQHCSRRSSDVFCLFLWYVDNRLLFMPRHVSRQSCIQLLQNNHFHGGSIQLENLAEYYFLGFSLDFANGRILYNRKCCTDLLDALNAALTSILLSGVLSRAHIIKMCSYPLEQVRYDLQFLWNVAH